MFPDMRPQLMDLLPQWSIRGQYERGAQSTGRWSSYPSCALECCDHVAPRGQRVPIDATAACAILIERQLDGPVERPCHRLWRVLEPVEHRRPPVAHLPRPRWHERLIKTLPRVMQVLSLDLESGERRPARHRRRRPADD